MSIVKKTRPYELLVRWGEAGSVAGAHVQFLEEVVDEDDGGKVLVAKIGDAIPVSLAGEAGFPLADILQQVLADSLATTSARIAEAEQAGAVAKAAAVARDDALGALKQAQAEREQAVKERAALRVERDDLLRQLSEKQ